MKRIAWTCLFVLAGCATQQPEVRSVPETTLVQALQPGVTTKAQAAAALAPEKKVAFDSGYETWLYHYATPAGAGEYVALFGPDGVLRKTRKREPSPPATGTAPAAAGR
ncbi:hypothetical protein E4L96_09780 [Massilia arenosa]|uniref:Outer membrane protein assembly factor BamE n=1 Tax=Zemynaea arenosa TaxID=2561931 RepID=A0A4Y9SGZ1_9BURK|nr:hypothetical protein [Massilia arenosa]TFW20786.1 hypothetical protein E4L96_09780 [Massilia arenosa]